MPGSTKLSLQMPRNESIHSVTFCPCDAGEKIVFHFVLHFTSNANTQSLYNLKKVYSICCSLLQVALEKSLATATAAAATLCEKRQPVRSVGSPLSCSTLLSRVDDPAQHRRQSHRPAPELCLY